MEYKKEDWVVGRMYKFIGDGAYTGDPDDRYPNPGFVVGEVYEMVTEVCEYWGCPDLLPDAKFLLEPGCSHWYEISAFVSVERS